MPTTSGQLNITQWVERVPWGRERARPEGAGWLGGAMAIAQGAPARRAAAGRAGAREWGGARIDAFTPDAGEGPARRAQQLSVREEAGPDPLKDADW